MKYVIKWLHKPTGQHVITDKTFPSREAAWQYVSNYQNCQCGLDHNWADGEALPVGSPDYDIPRT